MLGVNHKRETEGDVPLSHLNSDEVFRRKKDRAGNPGLQGRKGRPGTEKAGRDWKGVFHTQMSSV